MGMESRSSNGGNVGAVGCRVGIAVGFLELAKMVFFIMDACTTVCAGNATGTFNTHVPVPSTEREHPTTVVTISTPDEPIAWNCIPLVIVPAMTAVTNIELLEPPFHVLAENEDEKNSSLKL